jgi:hypothetical protein
MSPPFVKSTEAAKLLGLFALAERAVQASPQKGCLQERLVCRGA